MIHRAQGHDIGEQFVSQAGVGAVVQVPLPQRPDSPAHRTQGFRPGPLLPLEVPLPPVCGTTPGSSGRSRTVRVAGGAYETSGSNAGELSRSITPSNRRREP